MVFQLPLSVPWERHAEILLGIKGSLEKSLKWKGREFSIPADLGMGKNMDDWDKDNNTSGIREVTWVSDKVQLGKRLMETWRGLD